MTIHQQTLLPQTINLNDIVVAEGVARATTLMRRYLSGATLPASPAVGRSEQSYVDELIQQAAKSYGALTGNEADDIKLLDWLVAEYRKSF